MRPTMHDDLEVGLRELFERQAEAMPMHAQAWDDPPVPTVATLNPRRSRPAVAAIVSVAAAVALVVGIVAITPGRGGVRVGGQPGMTAAVHFATPKVSLSASALSIDAGGRHFTAAGSVVAMHSDPGTRNGYTTLELTWNEEGVEMRLNIYFASDGHNWWASEMRTYNGKSPGDWIDYQNTYFRSPLGHAFAGDLNVASADGTGHLRISNLQLQPFLRPAACEHATAKYVLDLPYDHVDMPNVLTGGFGLRNSEHPRHHDLHAGPRHARV